jgi:hypothetical protein
MSASVEGGRAATTEKNKFSTSDEMNKSNMDDDEFFSPMKPQFG